MPTLVPTTGTVLINTPVNNTLTAQIEVTGFANEDITWTWQLIPQDDAPEGSGNFDMSPTGSILYVNYFTGNGLFPIQHIDYLATPYKESRVRIYSWDDLPEPKDSPYIVSVLPIQVNSFRWTLNVEATGFVEVEGDPDPITGESSVTLEEETVSGSYEIIIQANHGVVKDKLLYELSLREDL